MPTLLHLDSSPMGDASISRRLTLEFVQDWRRKHPDGAVITRDLTARPLPLITPEYIAATATPDDARTPAQRELLAVSDTLVAELYAADEYVIGVPMHHFTIATHLRIWLDQVVRIGKTFAYVDGVPAGLLKNKRAHFVIASGGVYAPGTPRAAYDFVEPYLRTVFGFIGVTDTTVLAAGGTSALRHGTIDLPSFLAPHLETIRSQLQAA